jgi:hypothetical protein
MYHHHPLILLSPAYLDFPDNLMLIGIGQALKIRIAENVGKNCAGGERVGINKWSAPCSS